MSNGKGRDYMMWEEKAILQYIIDHNLYDCVKGRAMWTEMEQDNIVPSRTWQSLKEHFLKKVVSKLNVFDLTTEQVQRFKEGMRRKR